MLLQCTLVASSTEDEVNHFSSHLCLNLWETTLGGGVIQVNFRGTFSGAQSVRMVCMMLCQGANLASILHDRNGKIIVMCQQVDLTVISYQQRTPIQS